MNDPQINGVRCHPEFLFVSSPPKQLFCPVSTCTRVFVEPVALSCGHSLCRSCTSRVTQCPICMEVVDKRLLVKNLVLQSQVDELVIHCPFGVKWNSVMKKLEVDSTGCKTMLTINKKAEHEAHCEFRLIDCPVSGQACGKIRFNTVKEHARVCKRNSTGSTSSDVFIQDPKFQNSFVHEGAVSEATNSQLIRELITLQRSNQKLKTTVDQLSDRVKALEMNFVTSFNKIENMFTCLCQTHNINNNESSTSSSLTSTYNQRSSYGSISTGSTLSGSEVWQMPFTFKCTGILRGHGKMIRQILVLPGESPPRIVSSSDDTTVKIWDVSFLVEGRLGQSIPQGCIATLSGHKHSVNCICVKDGIILITGDRESCIKFWDLRSFKIMHEIPKATDRELTSLATHASYLFTGSFGEIIVWRVDSSSTSRLTRISGLNHYVRSLIIRVPQSPLFPGIYQGVAHLIAGAHDHICVWEIPSDTQLQDHSDGDTTETEGSEEGVSGRTLNWKCIIKIKHTFGSVYSLALKDNTIVAGTYNKCIHMFSLETGMHIGKLSGHLGPVNSMTLNTSAIYLLSASGDGSVQVWDLRSSLMVQQMHRHGEMAQSVALLGNLVFSGGDDAELKVYKYTSLTR